MKHTLDSLIQFASTPEGIQQIRVLVAELDGWKHDSQISPNKVWIHPNATAYFDLEHPKAFGVDVLPNYPDDLNLVHLLESKMVTGNRIVFREFLASVCDSFYRIGLHWTTCTVHASALQRCIAIILTYP